MVKFLVQVGRGGVCKRGEGGGGRCLVQVGRTGVLMRGEGGRCRVHVGRMWVCAEEGRGEGAWCMWARGTGVAGSFLVRSCDSLTRPSVTHPLLTTHRTPQLQEGADIRARAWGTFFHPEGPMYYGEYPLSFAACTGQRDVVAFLKRHGAKVGGPGRG